SGSWTGAVTMLQPATAIRLLARDNSGHSGISGFFDAPLRDDLSLAATDSPDPVVSGQAITYSLTVSNSGPATATGVVITNELSLDVNFVAGVASQGSVSQSGRIVVASIGSLASMAKATVTMVAEPLTGFTFVTNIATVMR